MRFYFIFIMLFSGVIAQSQVGINTTDPDASSILDIYDTNKGVLIPSMTLTQRTAITSPANGLLVFQNDNTVGYYVYEAGSWQFLDNGIPSVLKVAENGKVGYRFADQLDTNHADTGQNAINFTQGSTASTIRGARYDNSITIGNDNPVFNDNGISIGGFNNLTYTGGNTTTNFTGFSANTFLMDFNNNINSGFSNTYTGNNNIFFGSNNRISGGGFSGFDNNILMGFSNRTRVSNSVVLGRFNENNVANTYLLGRTINHNGANEYQVVTGQSTTVCSDCVFNAQGNLHVKTDGNIVVPAITNATINSNNKSLVSKEYGDSNYATSVPAATTIALTGFSVNWSNYGSGWQPATATIKNGQVKLAGLIRKNTAAFAFGETLLTLPVGYRPANSRLYAAGQNNNQLRVDVYADGRVVYINGTNGFDDYVSLEGIVFRID